MNSHPSPTRERRALTVAALSLPLIIFALLLLYRPFWGQMDDSTNIVLVSEMRARGIFPVWWELAYTDLFSHGRMRALYYATVPLIYMTLLLTQDNDAAFLHASVAALALTIAAFFWPSEGVFSARVWEPRACETGFAQHGRS